MSKKISIVVTAVLVLALLFTLVAPVFAVDPGSFDPDPDTTIGTNITSASNVIIGAIQIIGTAVAIIMLIWLGIKYVIAAPEEKADIKKSAFIYVIAAIFIFAASNILAMLKNFANDVTEV